MYAFVVPDRSPQVWMRLAREQSASGYRTSLPTSESPPPYHQAINGLLPSPRYEVTPAIHGAVGVDAEQPTGSQSTGESGRPATVQVTPQSKPSFTLNGKEITEPFITVKAVKAHLRLLACFAQLRKDVLAFKQPELEAAGITDEDRWAIFLVRAHHRFETWLSVRACEPETCKFLCRNVRYADCAWPFSR
jgi:hypothetical protein